ncbi:DUF5723 family protein [Flavobacterium sp. UMI-01]|uniref:DUF5723 family protein n=1 Tax=Flavobacterium sp. UMI-01 TaxID=1441053 RepID=UPI001C7CEE07|nr:DUF5723 family protein [Flavobacterium sp. UMI-01]GIZ10094.1 hypothetical protein FUMI01_28200 [Flavobacterium sp. UMI-01]
MKKITIVFWLLLLVNYSGLAQNKQILYNFTAVPQSMLTNPGADVSYKFYFGVPLLSGFSTHIGSSGFSAYDLFADNGIDFNDKLKTVIASTTNNDKLLVNEQLEIFNGGFRIGDWSNRTYVSFGMYQEFDALVYMPKDPAVLVLEGNQNYLGRSFNLGDIKARAEAISVLHLGFHKNIKENLIFGARGKIYTSSFNATSTKNTGYIYTVPSNTTVYEQVIYSNLQLQTSGIADYIDGNYEESTVKNSVKKALIGSDLGLGLDVGFTYYPKENIQWTGSIIDIGFISHSKNAKTYNFKGYYEYEGINPDFTDPNASGTSFSDFQDAIPLDTIRAAYRTWRPVKMNASYQYSFNDGRGSADCNCYGGDANGYQNAIGAQLFMMTTPKTPLMALTGYYQRNIANHLNLKATYTVDSFSYTNIGLGLSARIGAFNIYFMGDNLLAYRDLAKARSLSLQFGLNFVFKEKEE